MKYLFMLGLFLTSFCMYAEDSMSLKVDKQKKSFVVSLAANPSTGYQWSVKSYDHSLLKLVETTYEPAKTKLIGSGGHSHFKFALRAGQTYPEQTSILFLYARPWEGEGSGTLKTVNIQFNQAEPQANNSDNNKD